MLRTSRLVGHLCHGGGIQSCGWKYTDDSNGVHMWVTNADGKRVEVDVTKFGAHVTNWQEEGKPPLLFMSKTAILDKSKPIRGGIPVLFPQFGNQGPLKKSHGFARSMEWSVDESKSTKCTRTGNVHVVFTLHSCASTKEHWEHDFKCEYTIALNQRGDLRLLFKVHNTGSRDMSFTGGLHTYYEVSALPQTSVILSAEEMVTVKGPLDQKWLGTEPSISLVDGGHMRAIEIKRSGFNDVCIWNPWEENCKKMADLHDYKTFLCVEPIQIDPAVVVRAGESWTGSVDHKVEYCPK